jgi:hypothetical protein
MSDTEPPETERESVPLSESLSIIADELDRARDIALNGQTAIIASIGELRASVQSTSFDLGDQMQRGFSMLAKMIAENREDTDAQIATLRSERHYTNGHTPAE